MTPFNFCNIYYAFSRWESARTPSVQSAEANSDPSACFPFIIAEAEKLASYCKGLADEVGKNWTQEEADPSGENFQTAEANKQKVISNCRKLREALVTTRFNMELLENNMATRYSKAFGNEADIAVDLRSESLSTPGTSKSASASTSQTSDGLSDPEGQPLPASPTVVKETPCQTPETQIPSAKSELGLLKPFSRLGISRPKASKQPMKLEASGDSGDGTFVKENLTPCLPSPYEKMEASSVDLNEKARRELLMDDSSDEESSDGEIITRKKVSSKTKVQTMPVGPDDPKLKAECKNVVNSLTDPVSFFFCKQHTLRQ